MVGGNRHLNSVGMGTDNSGEDKTRAQLQHRRHALLGLGYIVGLKYAFVIFAGSIFVWWIIIPLLGTYGSPEFQAMSPDALFKDYARMIGIGGIAMAGVIGIVKS